MASLATRGLVWCRLLPEMTLDEGSRCSCCTCGADHLQHTAHVGVLVLFLKQNVPLLHLGLLHVPERLHRVRRRVRDNERLQVHAGIAEALLDLLDGLVELDLGIRRSKVPDTLGIDKDDMLFSPSQKPEDEIGVEVAGLEETHAAALAQVAE